MRFSEMDDLPVVLTCHWVDIALAQEADIVGLLKLVNRRWISPEFLVIQLDGASVLFAAMNQFVFAVALNAGSDARRSHGQRDEQQHHHEKHSQQDVA